MKPVDFDYVAPPVLEEAVAVLASAGEDGRVLAGGQSLIPLLNLRLVRPRLLVDLRRLTGLAGVRAAGDGVAIGAMTRQADAETAPLVRERAPLLAAALAHVGHPAIRFRGTVGGSLAHADPLAEVPAAALALDATLTLTGPDGVRRVAAEDFFQGFLATAAAPGEILTEIEIPACAGRGWAFVEFSRRHGDFALAGAAVVLALQDGRLGPASRIVVLGSADRCHRARAAEARLHGEPPTASVLDAAAAVADAGLEPASDVHGSAEYRRHLVRTMTARALGLAAARLAAP